MEWSGEKKKVSIEILKTPFFRFIVPKSEVREECQKSTRDDLILFVVKYRSTRTGKQISPRYMNAHILAIQRVYDEWGFTLSSISGPIINGKEFGLESVCDNLFEEQQSQGNVGKQHNLYGLLDLIKLISSESFQKCTPKDLSRIVLILGLTLRERTTVS